ncbi:PREDICTED: protein bric-a-brac 1-like isoform X3 [Nicrophorus vespilloides]|uniref:Protein bric-a-brac 1-like isoform X3 n=1 Tax=Nicrophorus vespilloides TaxID=110193 RepID=A0ABM1N9J7_NICVS|nr:PREDICTED: protein bric-a-brac 1-like isoform X3 [Nicrophorus vespilloides]
MSGQHYCLRWNNYQTNMTSVFHQLLQNEAFVDVTLACNDLSLKAHKVVLSACSSYFQKLLLENPCKHPTIIMPQDVCYADLKFIIEFVYKGEIDVSQAELQSILKTADQLKIKGLCESPEERLEGDPEADLSNSGFPFAAREYPKIRRRDGESPSHGGADNNNRKQRHRKSTAESSEAGTAAAVAEVVVEGGREEPDEAETPPENSNGHVSGPDGAEEKEAVDEDKNNKPLNMSSNALLTGQFGVDNEDFPPEPPAPTATPVRHVDMQEHSPARTLLTNSSLHRTDLSARVWIADPPNTKFRDVKKEIKFETLRSFEQESLLDIDSSHHSMDSHDGDHSMHHTTMMITPELMGLMPPETHRLGTYHGLKANGDLHGSRHGGGPKTWTQDDMEMALDALRNHNMSLTKASATYGIPSTTLWQRAHRLGIDTPKKEGPTKSWTEESLNSALEALRTGTISANKASKAYGIPSSTLYKIARREGIRLAAPFNAAPTTWTPEDLEKALESIRSGQTSVQRASTEYGIPTGTLYGRCKREGIELSRSNPTPWSEDAMGEALEAVRLGHMSINQAAIHYNLPYSSLYGRFKRGIKYDSDSIEASTDSQSQLESPSMMMDYSNQHPVQYQNQSNS